MAEGKWIRDLMPETPVEEAARHVLFVRLQVVQDYLPRAALEADDDVEYVHQLRVGTRRADAALRIFAGCLPGKTYRKARKHLKRLRRAAGAVRDWDVFLADLLGREKKADTRHRGGLDCLIGYALGQRAAAHVGSRSGLPRRSPDRSRRFLSASSRRFGRRTPKRLPRSSSISPGRCFSID